MKTLKTLHILNGQVMFQHYCEKQFPPNHTLVPFNEAMCVGETVDTLFSTEFVKMRANVHQVSIEAYKNITLRPLEPLFKMDFQHIELWFDEDMFCQINLLTALAWLDFNKYEGGVDIHIVDHHFRPRQKFSVQTEGYYDVYLQVLIQKEQPFCIYPEPLDKGIRLYLSYLNRDSELMVYIYNNSQLPNEELVANLMQKFPQYGLGDTQYLRMIVALKGK